jgi:hypothetical protein
LFGAINPIVMMMAYTFKLIKHLINQANVNICRLLAAGEGVEAGVPFSA